MTLSPTVYEMAKRYEFTCLMKENKSQEENKVNYFSVLSNSNEAYDDNLKQDAGLNQVHQYEEGKIDVDEVQELNMNNMNENFTFTPSQMREISSIPVLEDTIFTELQKDFESDEESNLIGKFMKNLRI